MTEQVLLYLIDRYLKIWQDIVEFVTSRATVKIGRATADAVENFKSFCF